MLAYGEQAQHGCRQFHAPDALTSDTHSTEGWEVLKSQPGRWGMMGGGGEIA
jgi:hypothetical protein